MTAVDNGTIDAYDIYHEVYDAETTDFWERFPVDVVDSFLKSLPGSRVLNLGSGPGRDAVLLRKNGLDVVCVDGSRNMVGKTSGLGFESILCDFRELAIPGNSFDGVWAYSSLIHVTLTEATRVVGNIYRILKPGGAFLVGLIQGNGSERTTIGESQYTRYFEYYDDAKLDSLFEGSGFELADRKTFKPGNQIYLNLLFRKSHF